MQAFCSSITGMLATLAILKGVGVGDSTATPLAAALTWMFKGMSTLPLHPHTPHHCGVCVCRWCWDGEQDIVCLAAGVRMFMVYSHFKLPVAHGSCRVDLDCNAKRWR